MLDAEVAVVVAASLVRASRSCCCLCSGSSCKQQHTPEAVCSLLSCSRLKFPSSVFPNLENIAPY
jgi:hypothetical protein